MHVPQTWRKQPERYLLIGSYCENCGKAYFPKRVICPKCRRAGKLKEIQMPWEGKIVSFTKVHVAPEGFKEQAPYWLAIIELTNGARVLAQIVDSKDESVKIGAKVKLIFRRLKDADEFGVIEYGYKFRVVE